MSQVLKNAIFFVGCFVVIACIQVIQAQDLHTAVRLTHSERFTEAASAYKALILQNPNDGDLYYYSGNNYLQKYFSDTAAISFNEMADSATVMFQKGIQAEQKNPASYIGMGEIALIRRSITEAQQYYSKAQSLLPSKTNKISNITPEKQAQIYTWIDRKSVV